MTDKKIKVLTISDHPMSPSGVGTQTKYFIVELLKTKKFKFVSLAGAIKHDNYNPLKVEEWKEDWIIYPIDGYGNQDIIRSIIRTQKPDIVWFMTDPRFYGWLWQMENEIRALCPMVYYHVWDNYPYPRFNKIWYDSNDVVCTISKLTSDLVQTVAPDVEEHYLPHAIPEMLFKRPSDSEVLDFRKKNFNLGKDDFLIFWNSRNARRKQSGTLIWWFKSFLDKMKEKHPDVSSKLVMHTDPRDPNGQDLYVIINELKLEGKVFISTEKIPPNQLALAYAASDCTVGISDAEGFGLSTFESLCCETPIIVTMTGGLQEQVTNFDSLSEEVVLKRNLNSRSVTEYENGIGIEPASKAIIGSQDVPYIHEDRLSEQSVVEALMMMYEFGPKKRHELGKSGREHVLKNYNFENFSKKWEKIMIDTHEKHGSWDTRKNYKAWELRAV